MTGETQTAQSMFSQRTVDHGALQIRLETNASKRRIEFFLRGKRETEERNEQGDLVPVIIQYGLAKANDEGVHSILAFLESFFNNQVVQGNLPSDRLGRSRTYDNYIEEIHLRLNDLMILNKYNWEINDSDYDGIISQIMILAQGYLSRLIDNKERDSYSTSLQSNESKLVKNEGFKLFGS